MKAIKKKIVRNRSYRRFDYSKKLTHKDLREFIDAARISQCSANLQPLRYISICSSDMAGKVFTCLKWAGYLQDWDGPGPQERPSAYIILLTEKCIDKNPQVDAGLAMQNLTLTAISRGIGSCIIGNIDRKNLGKILQIDPGYSILYVIALGYPRENVNLIECKGDIKYFRDDEQNHFVPKRSLETIVLFEK